MVGHTLPPPLRCSDGPKRGATRTLAKFEPLEPGIRCAAPTPTHELEVGAARRGKEDTGHGAEKSKM